MTKTTAFFKKVPFGALFFISLILLSIFSVFAQQGKGKLFSAGNDKEKKPVYSDNFEDPAMVYLNARYINTATVAAQAERRTAGSYAGKRMHLVKFKEAIRPEWHKMLAASGAEVIDYIPNYTYLIYAKSESLQLIQAAAADAKKSGISWDGAYKPAYRISPDVYKEANGQKIITDGTYSIQLYADAATNNATLAFLRNAQVIQAPLDIQRISHYVNVVANINADAVQQLANREDVISIHAYVEPKQRDESQNIIMTGQLTGNSPTTGINYLTYLAAKGFAQAQFDASGFVVNVNDGGLDSGSIANVVNPTSHFALYKNGDMAQGSRVAFIHKAGTAVDVDTKGCEGHGNINTHIIGGYIPDALLSNSSHTDINGFRYGLGVAPFVKVGNTTIFSAAGNFTNPQLSNLEAESYRDGGRISSNSWGANVGGAYTANSQAFDFIVRDAQQATSSVPVTGNQEMVVVFSAGNAGTASNSIGAPASAKNVITVGASEGVRPFGGADGCGTADGGANSAMDIINFSSRGPCADGRTKPDIMAPGTHITGGVFQRTGIANPTSGTGNASPCFIGEGVCGGLSPNIFFPAGQTWTTASSGTSHSAPAVAGFAALIRQHFINKGFTVPSPAMTKSLIMNSAAYMTGLYANDNLFSTKQGMGLVNMEKYFGTVNGNVLLRDQLSADLLTATDQSRSFTGVISSSSQPVRITLAYSDAPGSTTGNSYVNNLDLEVRINGVSYLGNVFTGANSVTGGTADVRNNVESVFLPAGVSGNVLIKVTAKNIAGDGVPNNASPLDQDFALVASNFIQQPMAIVSSTGPSLTAETCGTGLVPDPKEMMTVDLPVTNEGTMATLNLTATLQSGSGVVMPSPTQNYGALTPGGTATRTFTFFVNNTVACGSSVTLTWNITDGPTSHGTVTKTYVVGTTATTTSQNFDGVTAPALPVGWTQNQILGTTITAVTTATAASSTPNSIYLNEPASDAVTAIESPAFVVNTLAASVSFQKSFDMENTYDGVLMEIKIGSDPWVEIITAGGSFVTGGYNNTISTATSSTIAGLRAWTGASVAWSATQVNLPAAAFNQTVRVRWLLATDLSDGGNGFKLDNVVIIANSVCTPCNTLPLNLLSFTGSKQKGYNNLLWKTAAEINTQSFELQYSPDGNTFRKEYSVMANGSGNNEYQQRDNGEWIAAISYYRLKMIDKDGRFVYSNVVKLAGNTSAAIPSALYPNPTKAMTTLSIGNRDLLGTRAVLTDIAGKILQRPQILYNTTRIDLSSYPAGTYLLKLSNGETFKLVRL